MIAPGTVIGGFVAAAYRDRSVDGVWRARAQAVRYAGLGLHHRGLTTGTRVGLIGPGGPDWVVAELAVLAAGGVTVPLAAEEGSARLVTQARDLALGLAFVDDADVANALRSAGVEVRPLSAIGGEIQADGEHLDTSHPDQFERIVEQLTPTHPATVAVDPADGSEAEHAHGAVVDAVRSFIRFIGPADAGADAGADGDTGAPSVDPADPVSPTDPDASAGAGRGGGLSMADRSLAVLPLTTFTGRLVHHYWPALTGASINHTFEGTTAPDTVAALVATRPTVLVTDASFVENFLRALSLADPHSQQRRGLGRRHRALGRLVAAGEHLNPIERAELAVLDRLVATRHRADMGLEDCRAFLAVGDVSPVAVQELAAIGIPVQRAFADPLVGLVAAVPTGSCEAHSVGPPLPGMAVRLGLGHEIEVQPEWNEWNDGNDGNDGWRATGRRGTVDARGWLRVQVERGARS